jgi:hypothetical protein
LTWLAFGGFYQARGRDAALDCEIASSPCIRPS